MVDLFFFSMVFWMNELGMVAMELLGVYIFTPCLVRGLVQYALGSKN